MRRMAAIVLAAIVLAGGAGLGAQLLRPPTPPSESDADYPAYAGMMANLKALTVAPHPSGSAEMERVRAYLLAQIRAMGLEAKVEKVTYTVADVAADLIERKGAPDFANAAPIDGVPAEEVFMNGIRLRAHFDANDEVVLQNILVKLDAPGTDRGILMSAHYDTKPKTPGAADDMVAVTALLEAMREQALNPRRQSDLYFLFTDGEELGGLGAKAFVQSHPELRDRINLVANFEARGNRGGLLMFETSDKNLDAVRYFQAAVAHPLAFSFTAALYHHMPNETDLTRYLRLGFSGLNFASAEGVETYHAESDNWENLDRGTAYHFLRTTLDVADYAAQVPFEDGGKENSLFFPVWPGRLLIMRSATSYLLSVTAAVLAAWWLIMGLRAGRIRPKTVIAGTSWLLGGMVGAALLSWGLVFGVTRGIDLTEGTKNDTVFLSIIVTTAACALVTGVMRVRELSLQEALAGLLPLLLLLILGSAVLFQDVTYLFSLPTLGILLVDLLDRHRIGRWIISAVVGAGVAFLYAPVCWLVYVMFMLPITPAVVAIGVIPILIVSALSATRDETPDLKRLQTSVS